MDNINAIATIKYLDNKIEGEEWFIRDWEEKLPDYDENEVPNLPSKKQIQKELDDSKAKLIELKNNREKMENTIIGNCESARTEG